MKPRIITLCADDYGQSAAISQGILNLVQQQRLSAVSCLTSSADWMRWGKQLQSYRDGIDVGLHFNLTQAFSQNNSPQYTSLASLLIKTHLKWVNLTDIKNALRRQLDNYIAVFKELPNFIDGHQHVQHFPVVRQAIVDIYQEYFSHPSCYIRLSEQQHFSSWQATVKGKIIQSSGAHALATLLKQHQIPYPTSFAGIYHFNAKVNYRHEFQSFLSQLSNRGLIMCHPGLPDESSSDELAKTRPLEYQYFMGSSFVSDCREQQVMISRFFN